MFGANDKAFAHESAKLAALAGGRELRDRFEKPRTIRLKGPADLVTDADTAAEAQILALLRSRHPNDAILAEESGRSGESEREWIIDPLDGTTNYAHAVPHFSVSIAYRVEGITEVGVIYDVMRDELFHATRGGGAFLGGTALHGSDLADPTQALLATGFPYTLKEAPEPLLALFAAFAKKAQSIRRFGSAALDLAWVAQGRYDGFFERALKPWDIAAGALIVEEAGGSATGLLGEGLDLWKGDILAAKPALHQALVRIASDATQEAGLR